MNDILQYTPQVLSFAGKFRRLIGNPERTGIWIIWGESGNGKTSFALQLAKYLTNFDSVLYNSIEEGLSESLKRNILRSGLVVCDRFFLLDKETMVELSVRIKKRRAPRIVIVDSLQYCGWSKEKIKKLSDENPDKLFIYISHASGREPMGNLAKSVKYHANVKIRVENYQAYALSRYSDGSAPDPYVIWEDGIV